MPNYAYIARVAARIGTAGATAYLTGHRLANDFWNPVGHECREAAVRAGVDATNVLIGMIGGGLCERLHQPVDCRAQLLATFAAIGATGTAMVIWTLALSAQRDGINTPPPGEFGTQYCTGGDIAHLCAIITLAELGGMGGYFAVRAGELVLGCMQDAAERLAAFVQGPPVVPAAAGVALVAPAVVPVVPVVPPAPVIAPVVPLAPPLPAVAAVVPVPLPAAALPAGGGSGMSG